MSRPATVLGVICLVVVGAAAGVGLRYYEENRPPEVVEEVRPTAVPTTFPRLTPRLTRADDRLVVTNLDEHAWTACMVDVNAGVPGGGFSNALGDLAAGAQASVRLDAFARADGRRFDPDAERVLVVDLHCETPSGQAHFSGGL